MISLASSSSKSRKQTQNKSAQNSSESTKLQQFGATLNKNIWLPDSPVTFAFFIFTTAILCGGLFLHINLSAQIAQAQFDIQGLEKRYNEIERENAEVISQIAIATSMFDIYGRATALGYVPLSERDKNFVAASEIQVPQPRMAAAPQETAPQSMTVADAFAATNQGALARSAEAVSFGGVEDGESLQLDSQVVARQNNGDSLGRWLAGLFADD